MTTKPLKVLHIGLGPLGIAIASDVSARGIGQVVAAVDIQPSMKGQKLSTLLNQPSEAQVTITDSLEHALSTQSIDCAVVTTSSDLAICAPTFRTLLRHGLPVVSTCEELLWPHLRHPHLAEELDTLAKSTGGRLLGTGVNPGFLMDTLPATASAVCRRVDRVDVWRIQDATTRRIPFQKKIGAAHSEADFERRRQEGSLRHVGLGESLHFLAHAVGFTLNSWSEDLEPVRASTRLECGLGTINPGEISGVRQVATGIAQGREVVRLEFIAAIGQNDPHDRLRIQGQPVIDARIDHGVHGDIATHAITLNALHPLIAAAPGLHTMATVGLVSCRNHANAD